MSEITKNGGAAFTWRPAIERAQAYLEAQGVGPEEAERLSRGIAVAVAEAEPASSEEAALLAVEEAKTLALGLRVGAGGGGSGGPAPRPSLAGAELAGRRPRSSAATG